MHRVRMTVPYLAENGWEGVVLAVDARECDQPREPLHLQTMPPDLRVIRTGALDEHLTAAIGLHALDIRAYPHLYRAGARLLSSEPFDLVYFSTTAFPVLSLGPLWYRRFGVPFAIDMQDPWVTDYYERAGAPEPPGGRFKFALMQGLARTLERSVMKHVRQVISVSEAYPEVLRRRYPWLRSDQFAVIPFGGAESDFEVLRRADVRQSVFSPSDGKEHWAYVGRAGPDMDFSLSAIFSALNILRTEQPRRLENVCLHFVGTTYATGSRASTMVKPLAEQYGLGDLVHELPLRIPYFQGLRCLLEADALIVPGSDDPTYSASKIYPYILANRPLLAVFHERSGVTDVIRDTRAGVLVPFKSSDSVNSVALAIHDAWFRYKTPPAPNTDWSRFSPYAAREMTRQQCVRFDKAVSDAANPDAATYASKTYNPP